MQAILTRYIPPTNTRDGRIVVRAAAGRKIYPWRDDLDVSDNHALAAQAFANEFGWLAHSKLAGGTLHTGEYAFVLVPRRY